MCVVCWTYKLITEVIFYIWLIILRYRSRAMSHSPVSKHLHALELSLNKGAWHPFYSWVFSQFLVAWIFASKMGATPLYLAIILARAKAYSRASATLRVSGTVAIKFQPLD